MKLSMKLFNWFFELNLYAFLELYHLFSASVCACSFGSLVYQLSKKDRCCTKCQTALICRALLGWKSIILLMLWSTIKQKSWKLKLLKTITKGSFSHLSYLILTFLVNMHWRLERTTACTFHNFIHYCYTCLCPTPFHSWRSKSNAEVAWYFHISYAFVYILLFHIS